MAVVSDTAVFEVCADVSHGGDLEPSCFPSVKRVTPPASRNVGDKDAEQPSKTCSTSSDTGQCPRRVRFHRFRRT